MSGVLLATNSGNKQLQEPVGVDVDAYLRIGFDFVDTFDDVTVAVQHIALDCAVPVRDRLAARKLTAGFYIDVHRRRFYEGCVHGHSEWGRAIPWPARGTTLLRTAHRLMP